jgi:uncharacterized protein
MKQVFADTLYWVASITPSDPWHAPTLRAIAALGPVHLVTTEEVLVPTFRIASDDFRNKGLHKRLPTA